MTMINTWCIRYDLVFDPGEISNLAAHPRAQDQLDAMRERLARWMVETDDPLLRGPIVTPSGAVYNDPDSASPGEPTLIAP